MNFVLGIKVSWLTKLHQDVSQKGVFAMFQDPLNRMVTLLSLMADKIGELFTRFKVVPTQVGSFLGAVCSAFVAWCKVTSGALKEVRESSHEDQVSETIRVFVGSVFFGVVYTVVRLFRLVFKSQHSLGLKEVNDKKHD